MLVGSPGSEVVVRGFNDVIQGLFRRTGVQTRNKTVSTRKTLKMEYNLLYLHSPGVVKVKLR